MASNNSPIKTDSTTRLRHRSRVSESENVNGSFPTQNSSSEVATEREKVNEEFKSDSSETDVSKNVRREGKSLLGYFMKELTKNYRLEADASEFVERRDRVYTSVYTPKNLEKFLAFGFLQCLDSILYMVTFLPLRILVALMRLLTYPCTLIFVGRRPILDASQVTDLLKGLILVVSCYITSHVDMSMIYHIVRGQSIMKFYVFFNMLDVMDKLVSQFGQDILDSLYWTAVEPRGRKRAHFGTLFHLVFATVYVVAHTMMILMQAIILNVAFNSHNKNLLTVMMSNNFVEIKVNVFKRVDKTNLCQITYSDVRERFHYLVLLFFVFVRNMKELQWNWDMALPLLQDAAIVFLVEVFVDWIKHAFITKLSELSASHYGEFSLGLAQDIASSQKKHAFTNFSDQVCRRMGFTPMPLICLLYMVSSTSFAVEGPLAWLLVFVLYICLVSTKVLNSIILLGWAQRLIDERDMSAQSTGTVVNSQTHPKKAVEKKPMPAKPKPAESIPTKLRESDTGLYSQLTTETPSSSKSNAAWSSSFTGPSQSFEADSSQATWSDIGPDSLNVKPSNTFIFEPPPLSLSEPKINVQEAGDTNGMCLKQAPGTPPAQISSHNVHNNNVTQPSKLRATNSFSHVSHPVADGIWAANTTPQLNIVADSSVSPSLINLTTYPPSPSTLVANSHFVSQSHPNVLSLSSTHSLPSSLKSCDMDTHTVSSVSSHKRKHSATSINSVDSFFFENNETQEPCSGTVIEAATQSGSDLEGNHRVRVISSAPPDLSINTSTEEEFTLSLTQPSLKSNVDIPISSCKNDNEKDASHLTVSEINDADVKQNVSGLEGLREDKDSPRAEQSHESCC
ncbi:hypothetical protein EGW08_019479 [Elysia chlorotica]|uniref:Uncharacterized protein n=1 Tax=Elysia chlorotica TaxID=188477 RepID=A0A433SUB7_ELYCH|nr:hypothetical protein EGW08_019479 [Elysia chlorotica]